ncbi:DUF481 domain-containing protein [Coraliomargarita algicola]|uniref:DUF481 domain-containing protein n=1 Tax=Coraliomargarita algicola TaxID=3092156 RepID=A0ABZ0RYW8_9BACT|nr:DUF481 domain-containing protein [Coraliomargarita sp. J2-16]WPJ98194.1 DUF481 domain-containing protein [Coraliomargarita sp. J2-16]
MSVLKNYFTPVLLILSLSTVGATPSVVALDSGEQLIGEISPESTDAVLVLNSSLLGELKLDRKHVVSVKLQGVEGKSTAVDRARAKPAEKLTAARGKPRQEPQSSEAVKPTDKVADQAAEQAAKKAVAKAVAVEERSEQEALANAEERKVLETLKNFKTPDSWSGNVRLGVNLSRGDSRWAQSYATGKLEIKPKQSLNYYRFSGSYTYRQTERANGTEYKSTDKYDGEFLYRRTFWDNWFVQNAMGYRADQIKGIDREAQELVGIGYRYKPTSQFDILFGGGGGVEELDANYEDTRSGLNSLVNVFQEATWSPLKRTSLVQKFNYYWNPDDTDQFNYVFSAAIRVRLTDLLGFEFSYNKSFDNDVGDGNAQDDTQWRNALVVYF